MSLAPGIRLGPYEIVAPLGAGGMGEVWRACDGRLGRDVAVKILPPHLMQDPRAVARFIREARASSALNHPNIVSIHDVGEAPAGHFIVMELVEGQTLRQLAGHRLDVDTLVPLGTQIAKALTAAHAAGIVHRDVKPENIMVRDDGYVKVLDFGLARLIPKSHPPSGLTTATASLVGAMVGTLRYMSPEQARGDRVGSATDIFSLGLVLYELATGQHPFVADSALEVLQAILSQVPLRPSRLNPEVSTMLDAAVLQMLEKDPRLRPSAVEVERMLAELAGRRTRESRVATVPSRRRTVGRAAERAELRAGFESASSGRGLLLCVSGEPGIGKTTLVEGFLTEVNTGGPLCAIGRGRCSERLAGTEAYLPFLEALGSLLRGDASESAARLMKLLAPNWYVQVAPLAADAAEAQAVAALQATSQERLKLEISDFFQELSRLRPLVLFFDDLHWAGASTVDLVTYLATRLEATRLLIVVTYRPSELLVTKHPFLTVKLDLEGRSLCREIPVAFLSRDDIETYLALEFPDHRFPPVFLALVCSKTEGSPLFMVDLLRYLRDRHVIVQGDGGWTLAPSFPDIERELPVSLRSMIQRKIEQVSEAERRLLEAASVQGYEFQSLVVAGALGLDAGEVEERLEALDRVHGFVKLVSEQELPDRTLTLRYRFVHVLYQNAVYASLTPTRKASLSAAVAQALLAHYGEQSSVVASQLGLLFEVARDFARASDYFLLAAQHCARVFASHEVAALARRGLELLKSLPETTERAQKELVLLMTLGPALTVTKGFGAAEVAGTYARAQELCRQAGETPELFPVLFGLFAFHQERAELEASRRVAEQLLRLAENSKDPALLLVAERALYDALMFLGEYAPALEHIERATELYNLEEHRALSVLYGHDSGVFSWGYAAWALEALGRPDQALRMSGESLALATDLSHPFSEVLAHAFASWFHTLRREPRAAKQHAEAAIALSTKHGFTQIEAFGTIVRGHALFEQGEAEDGIAQMRQGLGAWRATGAEVATPYWLALLAEALGHAGQVGEGLARLDEALSAVQRTGERFYDAELNRLKGDLLLKQSFLAGQEAEICFLRAVDIARHQSAKLLELRAVVSLSRLLQKQNRTEEARERLSEIYGWFTEGFETVDLKEAAALLEELA